MLLAGGNPGETMPPLMQYFAAQRANGGQLVIADPRSSTTAQWATVHLQPAPGHWMRRSPTGCSTCWSPMA